MSKGSPLMISIERATSETLLRSDHSFNSAVKDLILSRPDMPKEAVQLLKKRLIARNPKIQILTLELLDFLVEQLSLPFHTQVSSRDFLMTLSQLFKSRDVDSDVKTRLKTLLVNWYRRFADSKDILPGFSDVYSSLKLGGESEKTESRPAGISVVNKDVSKKLPDGKAEKLKKDLQVVKENISLTNDMIRAKENPKGETLMELVSTLRAMDQKILSLIERLEDSEMLEICLGVKDELQEVLQRYEDYRDGKSEKGAVDLLFGEGERMGGGGFDDVFGMGGGSVFATNASNAGPNFSAPASSNFYSQPGPITPPPTYFPGDVSYQSSSLGPDLFGFNSSGLPNPSPGSLLANPAPLSSNPNPLGVNTGLLGVNPNLSGVNSNQLGVNPNPSYGFPTNPPQNTFPFTAQPAPIPSHSGFAYPASTGYPAQNSGFPAQSSYAPIGNIPQPGLNNLVLTGAGYPANEPAQKKSSFNYKPTENFDDPFTTSINLNPVKKEQKLSPKAKKEQNFDELFDFKF